MACSDGSTSWAAIRAGLRHSMANLFCKVLGALSCSVRSVQVEGNIPVLGGSFASRMKALG